MPHVGDAGFVILPFSPDGDPVGRGIWRSSQLSPKWLAICEDVLLKRGMIFDAAWQDDLSHIRTKFTSASGAAVVSFFAHHAIASSLLLLSGISPQAEREISGMFVESLRRTNAVTAAGTGVQPFSQINSITDRPLMVVIPWPSDGVSATDHDLVRELGVHLAAAFFKEFRIDELHVFSDNF